MHARLNSVSNVHSSINWNLNAKNNADEKLKILGQFYTTEKEKNWSKFDLEWCNIQHSIFKPIAFASSAIEFCVWMVVKW